MPALGKLRWLEGRMARDCEAAVGISHKACVLGTSLHLDQPTPRPEPGSRWKQKAILTFIVLSKLIINLVLKAWADIILVLELLKVSKQ
jgi:hypothetical protein